MNSSKVTTIHGITEIKIVHFLVKFCEADQRLCFRYSEGTIPLLRIAKISSHLPASVTVQDLCARPGRKPRRPVFSRRGSN